MAANQQESRLSLKLLIDEKSNRVVAAEAHKEFVEILFSFLTLPMGTIVRATSSAETEDPVTIGCMNNLYRGIEKLSNENWETEKCKRMVLHPRNPLGFFCQKLKVNIDDSWSNTKYKCSRCACLSWHPNLSCKCRQKTILKITGEVKNEGAFLGKGRTMFIISDDLQIRPACPIVLAQLLSNLGLSEIDGIREMLVEVSKEQVICLLARSLVSESPLTDVFLPNPNPNQGALLSMPERKLPKTERTLQTTEQNEAPTPTLNLQVTLNKSTNKLLFAKATNEFFDFLCTFLTIPLGSIIHVFKGKLGLGGCIYNLYNSVEELEDKWICSSVKSAILNPWIAQYHNCKKQPLKLNELIESKYLVDPRPNKNFAGEPSLFIVFDNLDVKPLSSASSSLILRELKVPFSDVEEQVITVGMKEALSLLKAALTSPSSALTNGLASFWLKKKPFTDFLSLSLSRLVFLFVIFCKLGTQEV
ncbi:uncharacterized protein LOC116007254 [Ipomoea triloba]|uniref:uncharacterized protein LOC116007254 n=1 Tax=Ipomoea triloba TaxID=35885 RepID=UPI00125D4842|nr:uncharacterized protein LOC116007254 [Ipomoea triloba]